MHKLDMPSFIRLHEPASPRPRTSLLVAHSLSQDTRQDQDALSAYRNAGPARPYGSS